MTTDDTTTRPDLTPPDDLATRRDDPHPPPTLSETMELGDDDLEEERDEVEETPSATHAPTTARPFIPAETASVHEPPKRPARLALLLLTVALVATALVGGAAYVLTRGSSPGALFGHTSDEVLILVVTRPKGARLFVDGVLQKSKSLQLQRSRGHVELRAEAPGYRPKTLTLALAKTRVLHLTLDPKGSGRSAPSHLTSSAPGQAASSPTTEPPPRSGPRLLKSSATSRPPRAIVTALKTLNEPVRRCFIAHGQRGVLNLTITITPRGQTSGVVHGSFAHTKTAACVLDALAKVPMPHLERQAPLTIHLPFALGTAVDTEKAPVE